jgi:hypothetical protein
VAQFEIRYNCGVIPKPRAFTSGARNLLENGLWGGNPLLRLKNGSVQDDAMQGKIVCQFSN